MLDLFFLERYFGVQIANLLFLEVLDLLVLKLKRNQFSHSATIQEVEQFWMLLFPRCYKKDALETVLELHLSYLP